MEANWESFRAVCPVVLARIRPFRIGNVEVRPASREVVGGDRREVLEPRVMQVLVALASARGEILSRDDLISACWEGRAVSDDAINRVLSRLRALARAFEAFQVETIIKVGYRLVGRAGEELPVVPCSEPASRRPGPSSIDRRLLITGGGAVALGAAGGFWLVARGQPGSSSTDTEVARLIAQARETMRGGLPDDVARATALLRLALEKDPDSAEAWGFLARLYRFQWEFGSPAEAPAMAARTRSAAARALELDPGNGNALAARATLIPFFGNWARAEAEMRRVHRSHPETIEFPLARLLAETGRLRDALGHAGRAVANDPEVPRWHNFLGLLLWDAGRLEEAERAFDTALARWPRHVLLWFNRFEFLAFTGRPRAAIAFAADHGRRPIGIPDRRFELMTAKALALANRAPADVRRAVAEVNATLPEGAAYAAEAVPFLSAIGKLDEAFEVADAYFFGRGPAISDLRFPQTGAFMTMANRETRFLFAAPSAALRADPRFSALAREIGLERYWRETGTIPDYRRLG